MPDHVHSRSRSLPMRAKISARDGRPLKYRPALRWYSFSNRARSFASVSCKASLLKKRRNGLFIDEITATNQKIR